MIPVNNYRSRTIEFLIVKNDENNNSVQLSAKCLIPNCHVCDLRTDQCLECTSGYYTVPDSANLNCTEKCLH